MQRTGRLRHEESERLRIKDERRDRIILSKKKERCRANIDKMGESEPDLEKNAD